MKNFIQPGDVVNVPAPADFVGGDVVVIGGLRGVIAQDVATGEIATVKTSGVYDLPKPAATPFAVGDVVEWDAGAGEIAAIAAGDPLAVVVADAVPAALVARVRLTL